MRFILALAAGLALGLSSGQADERACGYTEDLRLICDEEWRAYSERAPRRDGPALRGTDTNWASGLKVFLRGGYAFSGSARDNGVEADIPHGPVVSLGIGRRNVPGLPRGVRFEGEFVYARSSEDECVIDPIFGALCAETTFSYYGPFVNAHWQADSSGRFEPYLSVGVGAAFLEAEADIAGVATNETDVGFGYQARAGLEAPITNRLSVSAGYRFLGALETRRYSYHVAEAGLTYGF